jgi:Ca2+-binding RTX toxin-like protein
MTDNALIGRTGKIENTDATGSTIIASGKHQHVNVNGAVQGGDDTVLLGDNAASDHGDHLDVSSTGYIVSTNGIAVTMNSFGGTISNGGEIYGGGTAIDDAGTNGTSVMTVINSGKIIGANGYGILLDGSENYSLENTGLILGGEDAVFGEYAEHAITIHNSGRMYGGIALGGGDDLYSGHHGVTTGTIWGGDGDDRIIGGKKGETLQGGDGHDILTGGGGADIFLFQQTQESTVADAGRDLIKDFSRAEHDTINLSAIDANTSTKSADDAFTFIGRHAFNGQAGELHYAFANGHTFISGDVNGDMHGDFEIELGTHTALVKGDFLL